MSDYFSRICNLVELFDVRPRILSQSKDQAPVPFDKLRERAREIFELKEMSH